MTEVVKTEEQVVEKQPEQNDEPQYTPIQLKAIEQGWIPKEEFDGDDSEFIDAPEFVRRGELFKKIDSQNREIKQVRQALEALKVHNSKIKEAEYQRALKTLKDARKVAAREGELERAYDLEDRIDEIEQERARFHQEQQATAVEQPDEGYTEQFQEWVSNNSWYETNATMRAAADALGKKFYNDGHSPTQVLAMVEREIKKEFEHKFTPSRRSMAVEPSTRQQKKTDDFVMSEDEIRVMRKFAQQGVMTEAEYKKQLKATR